MEEDIVNMYDYMMKIINYFFLFVVSFDILENNVLNLIVVVKIVFRCVVQNVQGINWKG